jgi:hypothetical protein
MFMIKYIKYIALLLLLPTFSYAQVVISGTGEIVAAGDANIILDGDWTNNATNTGFTASAGTGVVYFHSANAQSIGGSKATTFGNITLRNNSSSSLTINSDIFIIGRLNFYYSGIMHVGTGSVTFMADGYSDNATTNKFIDGPATYIGANGFTFDIGDGKYAPVRIADPGSSAMTVTAQYYYQKTIPNKNSVSTPLVKVSDVEYWHITSTSNISEEVRIFWRDGDESGIKSINSDSLKFAKWDGNNWIDEPASITASSTASGYITSTGALPLSDLYVTFGSTNNIANPLPIQLLSFTAQCQAQDVVIEWSTASEENNDYFTILRSDDAEHYEEVAQINGAGNSNEVLNYRYQDWNAANGNYYYMLKQTDYDGANETFKPVYVKCDNKEEVSLQIFYDGANVYATLKNAESGDKYQMIVIDHTGRIVYEETQFVNANHYYRIPVGNLTGGLYSIIYYNETGNTRMSEKFMVR